MEVVEDARAIVLAGGTMSPVSPSFLQGSLTIYEFLHLDFGRNQPIVFQPSARQDNKFFLWTYHSGREPSDFGGRESPWWWRPGI